MAEEIQSAPRAPRGDDHVGAAANPEQHLQEAHKLVIQVQGKEGPWEKAIWALIKEEKGKTKTLTVFEGTRREAANHFFNFIHPNRVVVAPASSGRPTRDFRSGPRTGGRPSSGGRPQGRPAGRP